MGDVFVRAKLLAGVAVLGLAISCWTSVVEGAVGLTLTDTNSQTSANYLGGSTFTLNIALTETGSTDMVSGLDYQLAASSSGIIQFTSRTTAPNSFLNDPYVSDGSLTATYLDPNNGTDLGGGNKSNTTLMAAGTYPIASIVFKINSNAPAGKYVLSFYLPGQDTIYAGAYPNTPVMNFNSLGTYTAFVPEPASTGMILTGVWLALARRNRRFKGAA